MAASVNRSDMENATEETLPMMGIKLMLLRDKASHKASLLASLRLLQYENLDCMMTSLSDMFGCLI